MERVQGFGHCRRSGLIDREEFRKPDPAFIPIGGNFTMDPEDAAFAAKTLVSLESEISLEFGWCTGGFP
jgi:hypothetical protein